MNILHVDTADTWRGGQAQVYHLIDHLPDSVNNHLITPDDSELARRLQDRDVPVQLHHHPMRGEWDVPAAWRIHSVVQDEDIHLTHAHDSTGHGLCWMRGMFASDPVPLVVTRRLELEVGQNVFSRKKYEAVDRFIAISPTVKQALVDCELDRERISVIPSGMDLDDINSTDPAPELLRDLNLDPDRPVIGNVGALTEQKDQETFIKAADHVLEDHPEAQFVIAGKGDLEKDLQTLIQDLDREGDIVLAGFQEHIIGFIKTFDLFVLTSVFEGLCSTLTQVMASRVPVVATDVGGVPDLVEHGETGRLTAPESPEQTADEIRAFLEDGHPYEQYVENAYERARSYDYPQLARRTVELYREVMDE